jgi:ribosomal protein L40E
MQVDSEKSIEVFFSYASKDERLVSELEKHLSIMQRQGLIIGWHDSKIDAGQEWKEESNVHLDKADIILLLISADFMTSEHCYSNQMKRAIDRHDKGEAVVIPVLLRAVDSEGAPFSKLKVLPKNMIPVTRWRIRDEAFTDIAKGIRSAIKKILKAPKIEPEGKTSLQKIAISILYCPNCKAPVSLPMACWKCGLFPIQVCGKCGRKNTVDQEVCQSCKASLILVCNNCKTKNSLEVDFCGSCGLQIQQMCHECGERNLPDRENCQNCDVSLIQICSHCNQKNDYEAELCLRCGMPQRQVCITCDALNALNDEICWRCEELLYIEYDLEIPLHLANVFYN